MSYSRLHRATLPSAIILALLVARPLGFADTTQKSAKPSPSLMLGAPGITATQIAGEDQPDDEGSRFRAPGRSSQQYAAITSIRQVASSMVSGGKGVEIALSSDAPFSAPNNQQLMLIIGPMHFTDYRYDHGDNRTVIFTIDRASFDALPNGSTVEVGFGLQRGTRWDAGLLNKSLLQTY